MGDDLKKRMTWARWAMGFRISLLDGAVAAVASLGADLTLKQSIFMILTFMGKKAGEYIATHPIDNVEDTAFIQKPPTP